MTQTGTLRLDFTTSDFKQTTKTSWTHVMDSPEPAVYDVTFPKSFSATPSVLLSITGFNDQAQAIISLELNSSSITATSFKIEVTPTFMNSINGITVSWLATDA
ncbi:MAG: H-type lectin domain-containing protein [Acidobacteriota bacterium]